MELRWLKWSFLLMSIGSVLLAGYLMLTAKHSFQEVLDAAAIQAGSRIDNPDIKEYEGDDLSWRLKAQSAQEMDAIVILKMPVIDLYTEKREVIPVRANDGQYNKKTGHMHFEGEVQVNYQNWVLKTEKLDYFKVEDEIQIVDTFVMFQEGMVVTGKDMRVLKQTGQIKILNGVKMKIEENQ